MSYNVTLDEIKKFWPEKAPNINIVQKYVSKYEKERIVIKYGGNVLIVTASKQTGPLRLFGLLVGLEKVNLQQLLLLLIMDECDDDDFSDIVLSHELQEEIILS